MLYTKSNSFNSILKEERFLRSHYIENFKLGVGEILHAQVGGFLSPNTLSVRVSPSKFSENF